MAQLYRLLCPRLVLFLSYRYQISSELAYDIIHDVFTRLLAGSTPELLGELLAEGNEQRLERYLLAGVANRYVDEIRRARRLKETALLRTILTEHSPSIEAQLATEEEAARLREALGRLPEPYRRIFRLFLTEELSLAEIAERLNTPLGSIYTQFRRGIARLRTILRSRDS